VDKSETPHRRLLQLIQSGWRVDATDCPTVKRNGFKHLWRLSRGDDRLFFYF